MNWRHSLEIESLLAQSLTVAVTLLVILEPAFSMIPLEVNGVFAPKCT